jgi:hypothetical protein
VLAFGALGRGSSPLEPALVTAGLQSKSAAVRRAVLEAAARSGTPGLDLICRQAATRAADPDDEALAFLGVLGKPQDFALLKSALQRPELAIAAVRGLGALGRVESIPLLLEAMERPSTAAEAGSAFQRITGASDFTSEEASDVPANPEAEFAEVAPSPDPELARQVWQAMRRDLDPKESVQDGHRISTATTRSELDRFSLRTRRDLYLSARASAKASAVVELEHRSVLQRE